MIVISHCRIVFIVFELHAFAIVNDKNVLTGKRYRDVLTEKVRAKSSENKAAVLLIVKSESVLFIIYLIAFIENFLGFDLTRIVKRIDVFNI